MSAAHVANWYLNDVRGFLRARKTKKLAMPPEVLALLSFGVDSGLLHMAQARRLLNEALRMWQDGVDDTYTERALAGLAVLMKGNHQWTL